MTVLKLPKRLKRPPSPMGEMNWREFRPAPELAAWAREVFIDDDAPLLNPDHDHLRNARLGMLWTLVPNSRAGRLILGQAELMPPMAMGKWAKARVEWQLECWFGDESPDFLITIDAQAAAQLDDASFCALLEHELYHCGQRMEDGMPKFHQDGSPWFSMRGHDVEEFVGVVARYGAEATGTGDLVKAANKGPTIAKASIAAACGTCADRRRA